ncbi:MAG: hypothetical protein AAF414_16880 [Pseudomonadota bacterium]
MNKLTRQSLGLTHCALFAMSIAGALVGEAKRVYAADSGWTEAALTIANDSEDRLLACQFLLAHWFEISVGPIAPGEETVQPLLTRPATGDVAILNSVGDHMAVERLICGEPGADRALWTQAPVDRLRHGDDALTLSCRVDDTGADCQFD